jgi:hypothetical protein
MSDSVAPKRNSTHAHVWNIAGQCICGAKQGDRAQLPVNMTMLEAYSLAMDWLQYGHTWDSEKAEMARHSIVFWREEARRYCRALDKCAAHAGHPDAAEGCRLIIKTVREAQHGQA